MPTAPKSIGQLERERNNPQAPIGLSQADGRLSAARRGFGHRWRKLRDAWLAKHPLCERCLAENKTTAATVVHHKVKHYGNPEILYNPDVLESICERHHNEATARGE